VNVHVVLRRVPLRAGFPALPAAVWGSDEARNLSAEPVFIHREPGAGPARSPDMLLVILTLRDRYGAGHIYLCANHERPHRFGFVLGQVNTEFTPGLQAAVSQCC